MTNILINTILPADFRGTYPQVMRFFESFYERAKGGLTPGSLEGEVLSGMRQCYVAVRYGDVVACALSTVSPAGAITWDFCAGDDDDGWPEAMMDMFEGWAKSKGVRLIVICRTGWVRRMGMTGRGYRETHRVMELG